MENKRGFDSIIELLVSLHKLGNEERILRNFNLKSFIDVYVEEAFRLSHLKFPLQKFNSNIRQNVSSRLKIRREVVKYLERPFHWELINNNYLNLVQPKLNGFGYFISSKDKYNKSDINEISQNIFNKYGLYFRSRLYNLLCNNCLQS